MRLVDLFRSSGFRTGLLFLALFGAGSLILFGTVYLQTASYLSRQSEDWLRREITGRVHSTQAERIAHLNGRLPTDPGEHRPFALFAADGKLVAGAMPPLPVPLTFDTPFTWSAATAEGTQITYRAMAHRLGNGQTLLIGQDVDEANDFSALIIHALLVGGAIMFAIGLVGAIILGRSSARHIDAMRRAIERIVAGNLSERLPISRARGDLERLALVVNAMLDDLERMVGEVKGVCDNLAHDMRTPLGRLLAGLERARRRDTDEAGLRSAIDAAIAELNDTLRIFGALLRISEIEDGVRRAGFAQIDIVRVVEDAIDYHQPVADARGIRLAAATPQSLMMEGDPGLLFEAVTNLLDNAIKFTAQGGRVELTIGEGPWLCIADDGPGIPISERQSVMRRFQRGESSRHLPGNGLGLPLVSAIARLHGLVIDITDGRPGCVVTLQPADGSRGTVSIAGTLRDIPLHSARLVARAER